MKIIDEVMELDQEIKLKRKMIQSRMRMLQRLLPTTNERNKLIAAELLKKLDYDNVIPLGQADIYPNPIELMQADVFSEPIAMSDK